jgi:hypothetical protein
VLSAIIDGDRKMQGKDVTPEIGFSPGRGAGLQASRSLNFPSMRPCSAESQRPASGLGADAGRIQSSSLMSAFDPFLPLAEWQLDPLQTLNRRGSLKEEEAPPRFGGAP